MLSASRPLAAGRMPGDVATDEVVGTDGGDQQNQVAIVPPSIEKQGAGGQPGGTDRFTQAPSEEKSKDGYRQISQEE